ncbi:alpha/beta hydrolase [Leptolyngbya sp. AN02str]
MGLAKWGFGFAAASSILLWASGAIAAERIILKYGPFEQTVTVEELITLAETGEASPRVERYLRRANQSPETFQNALSRSIPLDVVAADRILNSPIGEAALNEVGEVIYPRTRRTAGQSLRAAIVVSASRGDRMTALDIMRNYPTRDIYVDGNRLLSLYEELSPIQQRIEDFLGVLRRF